MLSRVPTIATVMGACALAQLDVGALTERPLQLTQAIAGHHMRTPFEGTAVAGLCAPSRHKGVSYVLFDGHHEISNIEDTALSTRDGRSIVEAARKLVLEP